LLGFESFRSSNVKLHARQRAGRTMIRYPAASAERMAWRRSSSTSPRIKPRSRAIADTDRGWWLSSVINSLRRVMFNGPRRPPIIISYGANNATSLPIVLRLPLDRMWTYLAVFISSLAVDLIPVTRSTLLRI
jgi:hypothetical protein